MSIFIAYQNTDTRVGGKWTKSKGPPSLSPSLSQLHHPQLWTQTLSEPLDALLLRVNDERPTLTGGQDGSILGRHPIIWQALVMPGSHGGIICKHEDWIQAVCQGHTDLEREQAE